MIANLQPTDQSVDQSPIDRTQSSLTDPLQVAFCLQVSNIPDVLQAAALKKAKEAYVMALLAAGEISSGRAARLLNLSRLEIIERMGQQGISIFDDSLELDELQQEVMTAKDALDSHS